MSIEFNYQQAFARNLGWVSSSEQNSIKDKKIAIAGMGGVGGIHLINFVRMGYENFHIADPDFFELANFNRQFGANMDSIDKNKAEVMVKLAKSINPNVQIEVFHEGVTSHNVGAFLKNVDAYVDGLDVFEIEIREKVFGYCHLYNIAAFTYGPVGMGVAGTAFLPNKMSFEDYFGMSKVSLSEKIYRFVVGISPAFLHIKAVKDVSYFDLEKRKTGSTTMGCSISSGVMVTEVTKYLLKRGNVIAAPMSIQYDSFSQRFKRKLSWGGRLNPLFILKVYLLKNWILRKKN
ncbi:MAG: ThiF family adenylyltransferase [Bdellovibrionaceae bacterium]|nr:ThiF family adenylyltransferase [Pseudobdellovibrionaceae bacterium]